MNIAFPARLVAKEEVVQAFKVGGYKMDERFPEAGYVYFPQKRGGEGRVSWHAEEEDDTISICASWGFPSDKQREQILKLLALYVTYVRQVRAAA